MQYADNSGPDTCRGAVIFDNGTTVIRIINSSPNELSDKLVVSFDPMFLTDPIRHGFGEKFLLREGFDVVMVQKRRDLWYQDVDLKSFVRLIDSIARSYNEVTLYGSSMGGYAALYFAPHLNARVLAISPCCYIHPKYPSHLPRAKGRTADFVHEPFRVNSQVPGTIVYDPQDKTDREFVEGEIMPNFSGVSFVRIHFSGHSSAEFLHEIGALKKLVLDTMNGNVPRVIVAGRKGQSKKYLYAFARKCAATRRLRPAAEMMRRAIELSPGTTDFRNFYSFLTEKIRVLDESVLPQVEGPDQLKLH